MKRFAFLVLMLPLSVLAGETGSVKLPACANGNAVELTADQFTQFKGLVGSGEFEPIVTKSFDPNNMYVIDGMAYGANSAAAVAWGRIIKQSGLSCIEQADELYKQATGNILPEKTKMLVTKGLNWQQP